MLAQPRDPSPLRQASGSGQHALANSPLRARTAQHPLASNRLSPYLTYDKSGGFPTFPRAPTVAASDPSRIGTPPTGSALLHLRAGDIIGVPPTRLAGDLALSSVSRAGGDGLISLQPRNGVRGANVDRATGEHRPSANGDARRGCLRATSFPHRSRTPPDLHAIRGHRCARPVQPPVTRV